MTHFPSVGQPNIGIGNPSINTDVKYAHLWKDNEFKICLAAFTALGIFIAALMACPGLAIGFSILEIGLIFKIKNVYFTNQENSKWQDFAQTFSSHRRAALRNESEFLLKKTADAGDLGSKQLVLSRAFTSLFNEDPVANSIENKAQRFVQLVNNEFMTNPLEMKISPLSKETFKDFIEEQLQRSPFSQEIKEKIIQAIKEHREYTLS